MSGLHLLNVVWEVKQKWERFLGLILPLLNARRKKKHVRDMFESDWKVTWLEAETEGDVHTV